MFVHPPKTWLIAVLVPLVLSIGILLIKGFDLPICYVDALSVSGALIIGYGVLSLLSFLGAFDTFGYGFSTFRGANRKYSDLYEYSQARQAKRSGAEWTFVPYIMTGVLFLAAGIIVNTICL